MKYLIKYSVVILGTGFGAGYSPLAPATVASFSIAVLYYLLRINNPLQVGLSALLVTVLGTLIAKWGIVHFNSEDPKPIVIDEWAGMLIALIAVPCEIWIIAMAFIFFRLYDIWKPGFINRVQTLPHGFGIMADDVLAGGLALASTQLILFLLRY
jgi:phosphatidylglycerophosphatase A